MFPSHRSESQAPKTLNAEDLSDDINDGDVDVDIDVDVEDVDVSAVVDIDEVTKKKPHFLDYDAVPSPEFEENFDRALSLGIAVPSKVSHPIPGTDAKLGIRHSGEQLKVDKKFERDGEISDYELAASGYTKKEFTQDDNTLHMRQNIIARTNDNKEAFAKPKHFLDENPIPPDYMLEHELREHRSLDRNFERHHEQRSNSSPSLDRKSSQDRMSRSSRDRYTLSRFIDNEDAASSSSALRNPIPKGGAWAESYDSRFSIPLVPHGGEVDTLGPKVECVYSLLSMLGSNNTLEMSKKFLELSRTPETCTTLRRSGCIPLLVQMIHPDSEENVRKNANMALHNVVHSHPDEKAGRREAKVLRLLDQLIDYCNFLKTLLQSGGEAIADDSDRHPLAAISSLMKVSFDEEHRHAMCELGALQAIPSLVHLDHAVHGPKPEEQCCNSLRRYALMALTNLTFGDENNKALLCSQKLFMEALVVQLDSAPDDLLQVTASVLRNLSWRADSNMKAVLNEIGTVTALARAAMKNKSENTLKAILSALWNLSAHCSTNKAEFCAVDGALAFLVDMLTYEGPSKTLKIIENAGGILRNVSSHIAVCEHYRQILRERNCLSILLQQLKSESLTVVSNSCGTLWNLSARCPIDQKFLWDNGAVPMLRSLIHSKHAMISEGSSSALKNLLNFRPSVQNQTQMDHIARSMGLKKLPTLNARKKKALEQELGEKEHAETCDNLDIGPGVSKESSNFDSASNLQRICTPLGRNVNMNNAHSVAPPTADNLSRSEVLAKSESRDSVFSAKSDSVYENIVRSHSGTDDNRKTQTPKTMFAVHSQQAAFALKPEVEPTEEQPINYSIQYNENLNKNAVKSANYEIRDEDKDVANGDEDEEEENVSPDYATYQETDIDQPTDFSLRYAENQLESDIDISSSADADVALRNPTGIKTAPSHVKQVNNGNEILLILEDTVKCYQTEDTPYVISNAASVTDLHQNKSYSVAPDNVKSSMVPTKKYQKFPQPTAVANFGSGSYTPEKPINYCEEGTPGYFSRYESLSSLDESPPQGAKSPSESLTHAELPTYKKVADIAVDPAIKQNTDSSEPACVSEPRICLVPKSSETCITPNSININSAQETPLMFSRHSSMDSLAEEDVGPCDDKSSVVSDFSRMASGVISPSDIPDSPTQSMPQSPRRNSSLGQTNPTAGMFVVTSRSTPRGNADSKQGRLRSVFEDDFNTFHVENTPAQFSCATSLSNLSILDDENCANPEIPQQSKTTSSDLTGSTVENVPFEPSTISEGEEESIVNNDDLLLASCINIGMSRSASISCNTKEHKVKELPNSAIAAVEIPTHYCTEDTPALLSKVGSNTNLSSISINSNADNKNEIIYGLNGQNCPDLETISNRQSLNLSDDVSSNASDAGGCGQSFNILQQCILDGMKKAPNTLASTSAGANETDPIAMMRRGGSVLPTYLHVSDEINKYKVEDTPCNFSIVSGLSNLTVGSSLVEPAIQIKGTSNSNNNLTEPTENRDKEDVRREHYRQDDSLSSLSIDSEDDTNLLCQAIAAGCNRPKSNLGFSSSSINNKRSTSLSASQPISMNSAPSTSSLTNACSTSREHHRKSHSKQNNNDSYSSVESSDSNDNQSKSLFELCIRTGMNKTSTNNNRKEKPVNTHPSSSNPDFKNMELHTGSLQHSQKHLKQHPGHSHNRLKCEREKNDEELLMECINTGISKKISGGNDNSSKPSVLLQTSTVPKNVKATSAAALEPHLQMEATISPDANSTAAPDVEKNTVTHMNENQQQQQHNQHNIGDITDAQRNPPMEIQQKPQVSISTKAQSPEIDPEKMSDIGCNMSIESVNIDMSGNDSGESFVMESTISLERNRNTVSYTGNKHKDPDLMLKSVERLTQEFVSSAEQLRTNGTSDTNDHGKRTAKHSIADTVSSNSNNTWNEDTCPNDVSFPSVSITAPIANLLNGTDYDDDDDEEDDEATEADHKEFHDFAEITPTNEELPEPPIDMTSANLNLNEDYLVYQPNSLGTETETETDTLVNVEMNKSRKEVVSKPESGNNGINFLVGGEVQNASATQPLQFSSCSMNNSTIIAMEARNLAENFLNNYDETNELTYSLNSLELENIRPPSEMDSLNMSGYYQDSLIGSNIGSQMNSFHRTNKPHSPHFSTKSPKMPRKALPTGLVARRAIGQLPGVLSGSVESVNSSCNFLDNIKPPSLMDELLDSMISVASIQSEVADCDSFATTASVSNYETAAGGNDFDDNTITLQSCMAIPHEGEDDDEASINSGTLLPSDYEYSSAESTPRKSSGLSPGVKRTLTPKQKRKLAKDRFKTYTIAADIVLDKMQKHSDDAFAQDEEDETLQIEIDETYVVQETPKLRTNTQLITNNDRYKTQTIVCPLEQILPKPEVTNVLTINKDTPSSCAKIDNNKSTIVSGYEDDYNSLDQDDQNSETESCHGQNNEYIDLEIKETCVKPVAIITKPRITKPGDGDNEMSDGGENANEIERSKAIRGRKKPAYVSPYKMQRKPVVSNATTSAYRYKNTNTGSSAASTKVNNPPVNAPPAIERQGTFVKEEPSVKNVEVPVVNGNAEPSGSPSRVSKLPMKKQIPSPKSIVKSSNIRKAPPASQTGGALKLSAVRKTATPQRSNSNATMRVTSSAARIAVLSSRISTTTPPSRSNSNLNCASTTANTSTTATTTPPIAVKINQAQSRIAGIWKRVDDAKTKQQKTLSTASNSDLRNGSKSSPQTVNKPKLLRSSTFDTTPEQLPKAQKGQSNAVHIERKQIPKITQSKIAVNKTSFSVARKENIASRK